MATAKEKQELRKWAIERISDYSRGSVSTYKMNEIIKFADQLVDYVTDGKVPSDVTKPIPLMEAKAKQG